MVFELPETLWVRIIQPSEIWALLWSSVLPLLWTELTTERMSQSYQRVPSPSFMESLSPSTQTTNGLLKKYYFQEASIVGLPMRLMYSWNYSSENDFKFQNISNEKAERKISLRFSKTYNNVSWLQVHIDHPRVTEQWVLTEKQVNNLWNSCTKLWALYENRHSNKWCKDRWYMDNR